MDAIECIRQRRSIRKFQTTAVPKNDLMELIDIAKWSPSYKNSQPWEVVIVSGAKKSALSTMMLELIDAGAEPSPDIPAPTSWPEKEEANINYLMQKRKELTGMDLSDPKVIIRLKKANFKFYDAPHAIYLFQEASLSPWALFDLGLFAQSLMLAAHAKGLATVPQAFVTDYAKDVKNALKIPSSKRLVLGMSIGYPDLAAPVNSYRTERMATKEVVRWLE